MLILVKYIKKTVIFRHHKRDTYIPIYKEIGKGSSRDKFASKEIKRET